MSPQHKKKKKKKSRAVRGKSLFQYIADILAQTPKFSEEPQVYARLVMCSDGALMADVIISA